MRDKKLCGDISPILCQPEIGKEEISTTSIGEAQVAATSCEQEPSLKPEVVVESEPKETDSALASDDRVETQLQMAPQVNPQMGLQLEATATSETQASESIAEPCRESQEQTKDTTPKKPSKGFSHLEHEEAIVEECRSVERMIAA